MGKIMILSVFFIVFLNHKVNSQTKNDTAVNHKEYTIENCVNEFKMKDTVGTAVGYQYWFSDKDFIDGRTLKMSVVNLIRQHIRLINMPKMSSFLSLKVLPNYIWMEKQKSLDA